jgi:hypothetical protein
MSPTCHAHLIFYLVSVIIFGEFLIRLAYCFFFHFFISFALGQNIFFRIVILVSNGHDLRAIINTNRFEFQGILILKSGQNSKLAFLLLLLDTYRKRKNISR